MNMGSEVKNFMATVIVSILTIICTSLVTFFISKYNNEKQFDNQIRVLEQQSEQEKLIKIKGIRLELTVSAIDGIIENSKILSESAFRIRKEVLQLLKVEGLEEKSGIIKSVQSELKFLSASKTQFTARFNKMIFLLADEQEEVLKGFSDCVESYGLFLKLIVEVINESLAMNDSKIENIDKLNHNCEMLEESVSTFQIILYNIVDDRLTRF